MKAPTWQYFSLDEYRQRIDALRVRMEARGVDLMLVHTPENLYYLTGYQTPGYYWYQTLAVPIDREPVFITRLLEASNVEHLSWVEDSRPYGDSDDWVEATRRVIADLGAASGRIGVEKDSWFLTLRDFERLSAMLPSTGFVDCSGLVEENRMIKSTAELSYMREAAVAVEAGMAAGIEACEAGATENEAAAAIHDAQIRAGSEYTGLPLFITSGPRSALGHATWYRRTLEPGDTVFLEIPGCVNRYHAAMMRNVFLGEPSERMLRATEVMAEALESTIGFVRPGVTAHETHHLCRRAIEEAGLGLSFNHRTAYSIGIGFAPDWGEGQIISINDGEHRPLQAGMTFHLIPLVYIPGLTSVAVSETILVTESGCEPLTTGIDRRLFVA